MDVMLFAIILLLLFGYWVIKQVYIARCMPPGPWSLLPYIGVGLQVNKAAPHLTFTQWNKQYGDITSFTLYGMRVVVISSDTALREAFITKHEQFSDKMQSFQANVTRKIIKFIGMMNNIPEYRYLRRNMMIALRNHGDGLHHLEKMSIVYIKELLDQMESKRGEAFDPYNMMKTTLGKLMMTLTYGFASEEGLERIAKVEENKIDVFSETGPCMVMNFCPPLRIIVPSIKNTYNELILQLNTYKNIFKEFTRKRMLEFDGKNPKIYIDHFLSLIGKEIKVGPGDHHVYAIDEQDVISMGANMVTTGQLTTPIIMYTLLGMLVCHQDIQQRAYNEIRAAIGDRTPNQEDKYKLPYIEALILESMRYGTNAPSNPAHCTSRDTMLGGYFIPKGTLVIQNNWSISHDPRYWKNPWTFDPTRFIKNGAIVPPDHPNKQRIIAFGLGPRRCPGEAFAKNRIFLMITMMLQRFQFLPAEGEPPPQTDPHDYVGVFATTMKPYKIQLKLRK